MVYKLLTLGTLVSLLRRSTRGKDTNDACSVYHSPRSALLGLMSAIYSLGAICALPLVPYITDTLGRRRAILFGSVLMIIGAVIQTASQNRRSIMPLNFAALIWCS